MQPCELNATDSGMNVSSNDDQGSNQSEQFVNNICKRFRQLGMSYIRSLDAARGNQMWDYGQTHWSYIRGKLKNAQDESLEGSTFITTASDFQLYTGEEIRDHRHIRDVSACVFSKNAPCQVNNGLPASKVKHPLLHMYVFKFLLHIYPPGFYCT